ncbi:peptidyl-Asp metalloendopeptidase-like isoform X2 [Tigriopus californicus]|uniref:peptidyl-Asp metalloendopeptidase-like isoform X2 n=1 Tax=Tigriopus californicus TaxID=6832 RepID=UPI0027DA63AB|nr:peptidyl-Asp metalloendopeptidase-like isoform X2 [Tigriopus californicus]
MGALANLPILFLTLISRVLSLNLAAQSFVQLSSNPESGPIPYCENGQWISCEQVTVDLTALRSDQTLILPNGDWVNLVESSTGPESGSSTAFYQSEDLLNSMTITFFTSGSNEVNAVIHEGDQVFNLAPCDQTRGHCHVLAKGDPDVQDPASSYTMRDLELMTKTALEGFTDVEDREEQGGFEQDADGTYVATIKIYYTSQFAEIEPNVNAYISNMISQANACFRNSQTQIRLRLLCTQQLNNITEDRDPKQILTQFANIKGSPANLRGTADFAHLLVRQTIPTNCGIAYVGSTQSPFGVTKRDCSIASYTFSHEIGHNFGCHHDRLNAIPEANRNGYAFGYLIPGTSYRTTMAYTHYNHRTPLNLYSNPSVRFQNVPIGNAQNNCARKIRENARAFASIGSDTNSCKDVMSTCASLVYRFVPTGTSLVVQYPLTGTYGNNEQCQWLFVTSSGRHLIVRLESRDIENSSQCRYDMLAFHGTPSGMLGFCGTGSFNHIPSAGNAVILSFTSDGSVVGRGFRVHIRAV